MIFPPDKIQKNNINKKETNQSRLPLKAVSVAIEKAIILA
jgi:hypothetical protein